MAKLQSKPLWGLGWAGWCLLALAVTLAVLMIAGVDVRFWILSRIIWNFGWPPLLWFVASFIPSHGMFDFGFMPVVGSWSWVIAPEMRFSLITTCLTLVAMQIHPKRFGVVRTLAVAGYGVIVPGLTFSAVGWIRPHFGFVPGTATGWVQAMTTFLFVHAGLAALLLLWVTRSLRVAGVCAVLLVVGAWLQSEMLRTSSTPAAPPLLMGVHATDYFAHWFAWSWNGWIYGCLLVWAVPARLRMQPEHCCQECGYDLRASPSGMCPECGRARTETTEAGNGT